MDMLFLLGTNFNNTLVICWGYAHNGQTTTLPITFNTCYRVVTSIYETSSNEFATWAQICMHKYTLSTIQANNGFGAANEYICIGY